MGFAIVFSKNTKAKGGRPGSGLGPSCLICDGKIRAEHRDDYARAIDHDLERLRVKNVKKALELGQHISIHGVDLKRELRDAEINAGWVTHLTLSGGSQ